MMPRTTCVLMALAMVSAPAWSQDRAGGAASGTSESATATAPPPVPVVEAGPQLLTEDLRRGIGEVARSGTQLIVHYTGWLYEPNALGYRGRKFDSSRDRGQPFTFRLGEGRVIRGWEAGILGMQVGGLRRLVIPPALAYGSRDIGNGLIPPNSTLVFEVELLGVESTIVTEQSK
ncbi:MAG: Peptidylprolyl isomerase [Proteobacteria bacterium]|nr:Peptidylprolyl isomerase [Pseudomonadota bacterium]